MKVFQELNDGDTFKHNNHEYKKVPQVRVSCCRSLNAECVSDTTQQPIFVPPQQEVEIND